MAISLWTRSTSVSRPRNAGEEYKIEKSNPAKHTEGKFLLDNELIFSGENGNTSISNFDSSDNIHLQDCSLPVFCNHQEKKQNTAMNCWFVTKNLI